MTIRTSTGATVASLFVDEPAEFRDVFTMPADVTYTLTVDPRAGATGAMTLQLIAVADNTGSTAIGTPTTVVTTTIGENPQRTFAGTAGQKLTLHVSGNSFTDGVDLVVLRPDGLSVTSLFVRRPDRLPGRVHVAGDGDLHDRGRPASPADRAR